jgi:monothiol glutaredoxin
MLYVRSDAPTRDEESVSGDLHVGKEKRSARALPAGRFSSTHVRRPGSAYRLSPGTSSSSSSCSALPSAPACAQVQIAALQRRTESSVQLTPALRAGAFRPAAARWLSSEARAALDSAVRSTPVVLFMKGNLAQPQCGFSRAAVQVLEMHDVPQAQIRTFDVLQDQQLRADIKEYSCVRPIETAGRVLMERVCREWPTVPQLYVNGEFVGGCDIILSSACFLGVSHASALTVPHSAPVGRVRGAPREAQHHPRRRDRGRQARGQVMSPPPPV